MTFLYCETDMCGKDEESASAEFTLKYIFCLRHLLFYGSLMWTSMTEG